MPTESALQRANEIAAKYGGKTQTTAGATSSRPAAAGGAQTRATGGRSTSIGNRAPAGQQKTLTVTTQSAADRANAIFQKYGQAAANNLAARERYRALQESGLIDGDNTGTGAQKAARGAAAGAYNIYRNRADYAALSQPGESKIKLFGGDPLYDYINNINRYKDIQDTSLHAGGRYKYTYMTDEERGMYNYLYASKGKQAADTYLEKIDPALNKDNYTEMSKLYKDAIDDSGVAGKALASALTVAAQPMRTVSSLMALGEDAYRTATGKEIDPYSPLRNASSLTQQIRGQIAGDIEKNNPGIGGRIGSFAYQTGMSAGDSAMNMAFGKGIAGALGRTGEVAMKATNVVGSALMSSEVASASIAESKNKGYTDAGAFSLGLLRGGIEYASEAIGGEWIIKNVKNNPLNLLSTMLLGMIPEGTEEVMSDVGNEAANVAVDLLFGTDESYIANSIQYFTDKGDENPIGSTLKVIVQDEFLSFLGGAFATIGSSGVQYSTNRAAIQQSAQQLHTTAENVVALMKELDTDNPQLIGWLAELHDAENVEEFRKKVGEAKTAEEAIDAAMKARGSRQGQDSTTVNTDPAKHTAAEQAVIDEYEAAVDPELASYVENVRDNGTTGIRPYVLARVSDRAAADIQRITGVDTNGNATLIEPRMVQHILNRHGENGKADHSMKNVNDIARIQYVLNNYDDAVDGGTSGAYVTNGENGKHKNAQTVLFSKKVNGTYYVVEAVPDTSKKTVYIVSAYMQNKMAGPSSADADSAWRVTSDNAATNPVTDTIAQPEAGVNITGRPNENEGGITNAQTETETEGVLGQAQPFPAAGKETGRAGAHDAAAASGAAGLETAQPGGAGAAVPDGSGQRDAGIGTGRGSERLVRSTAELRQRAAEQYRTALTRQSLAAALWERHEVELQSARELGVTLGSEEQELKVFPQEHYDEEMRDVADWVASEYGLPVTYVSGPIRITGPNGQSAIVRGVHAGDSIIIQADHQRETVSSIALHEVFHEEAARDAALVETIRQRIIEEYSEGELTNIVNSYITALRGRTLETVRDGASEEELEAAALAILEEIFADANGGINAFGFGAHKYESVVHEVRQERAALRNQANGERETRGPPQQRTSSSVNEFKNRQSFVDVNEEYGNTNAKFSMDDSTDEIDREYLDAVRDGDMEKARSMFIRYTLKAADAGITPFAYVGTYRSGDHSSIATGLKRADATAIEQAAREMAARLPAREYYALVPMPSHEGRATDTLALARRISEISGAPVYDVLRGQERKSQYQSKRNGRGLSVEQMGMYTEGGIPEGFIPVVIDNVVATGTSAQAAVHALGGGVVFGYTYGKSSNHIPGLKSAEAVTYDDTGNVIPLSQRFNELIADTRYSVDDSEIPGAIWGDEDETFVNDTEPVKFRWAIVPLESLVVSNDTSGSVNPAYPAELQPRNRGRQASQLQMEKISRNINPRQLEDSPNAQNGAPIIRSDGVVIGGNIRSMALTDAYNKGRADAYRDYVSSRAARKFGLDTSELPERPVLVRVAEDVSDWAKLARDLNTSTIAAYSATERAMADAARMDSRIMSLLNPDEDGNINTTANKDFIQSFISNVVPDNERGAAITGSGLLSQDGLERAEYAIFAAAYKDADLMQRMSESLDNDMKNVTNALLDIAPRVMQTEAEADAGRAYDVGARDRILEAVQLYTEAKRAGRTVEEHTANYSLTSESDEFTIYVARFIEKFKRSAKQIRTFFNGLFDEIESYGDPNQLNFFSEEETHDYRETLEGAIKRYEQATGTELPRLSDWGAGGYEATARGDEGSRAEDTVRDLRDAGGGENVGERRGLDGERGDGGGRGRGEALEETAPVNEAPEIPEDTGLHLPPPPTSETEREHEDRKSTTRKPDKGEKVVFISTEDMKAPRIGKKKTYSDSVERSKSRLGSITQSFEQTPRSPGNIVPAGVGIDEYARAAEARAEAAKQERLRNIPKDEFTGSKHLQALGVRVENSVGIYRFVESMIANHRAARAFQNELKKAEKRLRPTAAEKEFAAGIAAGTYTVEDIPPKMNRATVEELADYYFAERGISNDLIGRQRKAINQALDEKMESLFENSADDSFKPSSAIVLNNRTPDRNMRKIFGDKLGEEINNTIFYPVYTNEAERHRFVNRMLDEVRRFEGSDGKARKLNKEERALVQMLIEGKAAQEEVAGMEMHAAIESAAHNIHKAVSGVKGELNRAETERAAAADAAREFSLSAGEGKLAKRYARWLEAQELLKSEKVDSKRVDNAVKKYGEMFNKFYDAINDFLVAHGYEPIGFIRGYAPHMQSEKNQELLGKAFQMLGINTDVTRLPSSIAGLTADYKPNKRWNPFFLQRNGDVTDYDIASAFESYVDYMSDVLYHTDDIMRLRAMNRYFRHTYAPDSIRDELDTALKMRYASQEEKADYLRGHGILSRESTLTQTDTDKMLGEHIDKLFDEAGKTTKYSDLVMWLDNYTNLQAGKQSIADRGWEVAYGRKVLNLGNKLTRAFARSQVAGNLSSMLNQSAQFPMIRAELGTKYVLNALGDNWNGQLRRSAWAQESDFLTGKNGIDYLVTDWRDMIVGTMFKPADFMDGFMATLAVRGRYLKEIDAGKSHAEAMKEADRFGREVMGSRMRGTRPTAYDAKNPVSQMMHIFQIEAANAPEHLFQDVLGRDYRAIKETRGKSAAVAAVAGVIVKMLLSAFMLNRLSEEVYGGTPAPFDIFGLMANFVASGKGVTTNQYLKTMIDNGMEKLTGERLFDTDEDRLQDDFDLEQALKDTGYNISNDIPFLRNAAALLGLGDNSLPIPDVAGSVTNVYEAAKENGIFSAETGGALALGAAQWIPGGRQLTKSVQGLQTMNQGGYYVNGKLYYPVEDTWYNWLKAVAFGRSSLYDTNAFYAGDDKKLSEKQTEMYRELTEDGADRFEVYRAVQDWRDISGNEDLGSYEKGRQERELVKSLDLPDRQKLTFYQTMTGADSRAEKFTAIMASGLSFDETLDAYDAYARYDADESKSKTEKANAFAAWVDRQDYKKKEKDAVRENLKYYQNIPITETKVDKFTDAGMETDTAEKLTETLSNLKPLPGKTSVTDLQKYQAIANSDLSVEDQWTAIVAQTNPSYTSTLDKIQIYRQQGITPSVWTQSREAMYSADDAGNNNDSTDQAEAKAALDGMNIPDWQKAILWQTTNKSWKPNKNPYDREVGQAIYDQMHGGATAGSQANGGLTLGSWGQYSTNTTSQSNTVPASTNLSLGNWGQYSTSATPQKDTTSVSTSLSLGNW